MIKIMLQIRTQKMKIRAAVAWQAGQPLTIENIDLDGPQTGESIHSVVVY